MKVLSTTLATEKFEESMRKCFVDVGLAPAELGRTAYGSAAPVDR